MFPITKEKNVLLDRIRYLDEREAEARTTLECVRIERNQLVEQITLGFATTGCAITNFALVVCGGIYDQEVIEQYRRLEEDTKKPAHDMQKHARTILTVQTARSVFDTELTYLRRIHLAVVTGSRIDYNFPSQLVEMRVEKNSYIRSEVMNVHTGAITAHEGLHAGEWLTLGPLKNNRCYEPFANRDDIEYRVPYASVFTYALCPIDAPTFKTVGVDQVLLSECMHRWTRLKTALLQYRP